MRIVVLAPSVYSEAACAMTLCLVSRGHVPVGALVLSTFQPATLVRKVAQWGIRDAAQHARTAIIPHRAGAPAKGQNPHLQSFLTLGEKTFRNLREVAALNSFPVAACSDQNAPSAIARLRKWAPDLIIFAGGNILRQTLLSVPRLGVLNVHLGLLPEVRGMSAPEWSLLNDVPPGVTLHYMDAGIDTGPVLGRFELQRPSECASLNDLRNRLVAFGVEKMGETVSALAANSIVAVPQPELDRSNQFFVMHEWPRSRAAQKLERGSQVAFAESANG